MVNTKFWSDNFIRENLNPLDRYLFLYFLTNEKTNISGIYELPISVISSETGIEKEMLTKMMKRLKDKVCYYKGWVILKNFIKYQNLNSPLIQKGVGEAIKEIPEEIKLKITELGWYIYGIDMVYIPGGESQLQLQSKSQLQSQDKEVGVKDIVNYFFTLKGWDNKDKPFYRENKISYTRHLRPAKELLGLCDGSLEEAKSCLKKLADWAISRNLDWSIETVFKKWYDLDILKPKEKKAYFDGDRVFEMGGKKYVLKPNGEKLLFNGNESDIKYE